MRGHIKPPRRLQDGSLRYDVVFDAPRMGDGKRKQITKTYMSKKEAEKALTEHLRAVNNGTFHESRMTVEEYLDTWISGKQALRATTTRSYAIHIRLYLKPHLGRLRLTDLRPHHVEAMYRAIRAANAGRERAVGPSTMRRIHATLLSALNSAVKRRLISFNPAAHVELQVVQQVERSFWEPEHVARFLDSIKDDPLMPMLHLMAFRGLRRGEAIGLRWQDIDLDGAVLRVHRQIVQLGHRTEIGEPKTKRSARVVSLDQRTVEVLRSHKARQASERLAAGPAWLDQGWTFTRPDGTSWDPGYVTKRFARLATNAKVPVIRLHDLRHTSASLGLLAGETLKEVSVRLGHSSIAITADVYSHITPTMATESAERIAALVEGSM